MRGRARLPPSRETDALPWLGGCGNGATAADAVATWAWYYAPPRVRSARMARIMLRKTTEHERET